jgi:hypothetical protein
MLLLLSSGVLGEVDGLFRDIDSEVGKFLVSGTPMSSSWGLANIRGGVLRQARRLLNLEFKVFFGGAAAEGGHWATTP